MGEKGLMRVTNKGRWQKGQSGNAKGKQPNTRALATVLREMGEQDSYADISNQRLLARAIWEGLSHGEIKLISGKRYELGLREWMELMRWLHNHVDGALHMGVNSHNIDVETVSDEVETPEQIMIQYGDDPPLLITPGAKQSQEEQAEAARQWLLTHGEKVYGN